MDRLSRKVDSAIGGVDGADRVVSLLAQRAHKFHKELITGGACAEKAASRRGQGWVGENIARSRKPHNPRRLSDG